MNLTVNGEVKTIESDPLTLPDLLQLLAMDAVPVVVEHNREPLLPAEHAHTVLRNGDQIEIVRVVAGG